MDFDQAFQILIGFEGNYSNDPADPGGETRFGISKRAYPNEDILNLTLDRAKEIYLKDYWCKALCPALPDPIRFQVFDTAVNSGTKQATILLQRALGVSDDGVAGPKTLGAITALPDPTKLAVKFVAQRLRFMAGLPTWEHFGKGWARRIADNLEEVAK